MHFDLYDPVAAAGLTPAALYVKAEPALAVSLGLGVGRRRKQVPDQIEHARIRCRVGPGRPDVYKRQDHLLRTGLGHSD